MKKVCHFTSVHPRYDTRVFWKECKSTYLYGYKVYLVVADGKGNETKEGVEIIDIGKPRGRLHRMAFITFKMLFKSIKLNADIYHFHDPELIGIGLIMKIIGKKVIYDIHEDYFLQIQHKPYFKIPLLKYCFRLMYAILCRTVIHFFDYLIAATPTIRLKYVKFNKKIIDIKNYPDLSEFNVVNNNAASGNEVCYIGGISEGRGILDIINAIENLPLKLHLAGPCKEDGLLDKMQSLPGWQKVEFHGVVDRQRVGQILERSLLGYVVLHPLTNYIDALPTKLFEYMAAGIPAIASDFPIYKKIVDGADCGLCIEPGSPKKIEQATMELIQNPLKRKAFGRNGRKAVFESFNWKQEAENLKCVYEKLIG